MAPITHTPPRRPALLSVVAPVFNERELIGDFVSRAREAVADYEFELVLVDDGSTDGTADLLDRLADEDWRVRVIHLSRNFGHQAALTAGLEHAAGDVVVMIDADLQDPPELIGEMVSEWGNGADVVYAVRRQREGETAFKLATASFFYKLFDKLAQVDLESNSGDFRLLDSYLPGFGSITIAVLLLGGIQLIALGVIGEYVGRIFDEVKHRPLYIVREQRNARPEVAPEAGPVSPARAGLTARAPERVG